MRGFRGRTNARSRSGMRTDTPLFPVSPRQALVRFAARPADVLPGTASTSDP